MIFLDGFGIGDRTHTNPYLSAATPFMDHLLGGHLLFSDVSAIVGQSAVMIPTDACLGVAGLPQSATGQTTIWTGINAAQAVGRHVNKYPTRELKNIIANHSIMKILNQAGKKVTFANAYRKEFFKLVRDRKLSYSTSTLITISSGVPLRNLDDLKRGDAVYQDFTNSKLVEWGYDVPVISAGEAGKRLATIAEKHDFTLYEYFISDHIGHQQELSEAIQLYEELDRFMQAAVESTDGNNTVIIIVSDHGNIEDLSTGTHTTNMVPTFIINSQIDTLNWESINSLVDITPFVLKILLG